jgi:hypothetical protein
VAVLSLLAISTAGVVLVRYRNRVSLANDVGQAVTAPSPDAANSTQEGQALQALPSPASSPSPEENGKKSSQAKNWKSDNRKANSNGQSVVSKVKRFFKKQF